MTISHTDELLLAMFARGDEKAFAAIYKQFYGRVLHFARKFVDDAEAFDITADVFFQLWQKRQSIRTMAGLSSFLFVSVRNRCVDAIRHSKVRSRYEEEMVALMEREHGKDFFLDQVVVELQKLLNAEIERLPQKMREVFVLSFREGMKPAEIAAHLKTSVKTVSNQKLSAIKILRLALQRYYAELSCLLLII